MAGVAAWGLASYLLLVLTPLRMRLIFAAQVPLVLGLAFVVARMTPRARQRLTASCLTGLFAFMAVDAAWVLSNRVTPPAHDATRLADVHHWPGEVSPKKYYPTELDFQLHKPSVVMRSTHFGEAYQVDGPILLEDEKAREALQQRTVEYAIDEHGFRSTVPMAEAETFALGDSYTFGNHVNTEETWHARLAASLGEPIYNLGVTNTSPAQHVKLVEYLLENEVFRPSRILWMLFEGNDLEDRYRGLRPQRPAPEDGSTLEALPLAKQLLETPAAVREASLLHDRLHGSGVPREGDRLPSQFIDGVELATRIFDSEAFGPRIFAIPRYVQRATRSREYVESHPNAARLKGALRRMRDLAAEHEFEVTVLLAPSAPRVHGKAFPDMPQPSERPHLLEFLKEEAGQVGFDAIELLPALEARADSELLYFTDDTHWNPRGHELVAERIAGALAERR